MADMDSQLPTTTRIEAFSDGVIAIIITIMVLDLKLPATIIETHSLPLIAGILGPPLIGYAISFMTISIATLTHHTLMREAPFATTALYWWNALLLFCLSLVPLTTAAVGEHPTDPFAVAAFGAIFSLLAGAFALLHRYVARLASVYKVARRHSRAATKADLIAVALYARAVPLAWVSVYLSYLIYIGVAAVYFLPIYGRETAAVSKG